MKRIRILVEGRLQGSNFRYYTQQQAQKLGLAGFVRHLSDGRIEIDAQGDDESVEQMLTWCSQGPQSGHLKSILFRYDEPGSEHINDFVVR
jgi:acylphosphatase